MKLHGSRTSPYVRKVRIVMLEKRIECDFVEDNVWSADTTVTLHNPLTKVPVLVLDDGMALYDSRVIVEYLDGITPVSKLIPDGGRERALVKRWCNSMTCPTSPTMWSRLVLSVRLPKSMTRIGTFSMYW